MGGFATSWKDEATVWGALWPVSATEQVKAMQTAMSLTHRIRIRYLSGVSPSWRIKYGNRYLSIAGIVNPNEANKLMDVICKEAE